MLPIVLSLIFISFSGVMMPGPMFAVALAKSYRSPWAGSLMALGHAVIEVPLILLIYFGFAQFFQNNTVQTVLSMLGGGMIIGLGVAMFRARVGIVRQGKDLPYNAFIAGILTTGFNPFFLVWWATIGSMLIMKFLSFGMTGLLVFVIAHWLCDFIWLTLVSNLIYRTHSFWGQKSQEWIFVACSLLLVGFGGWFFISGIQLMI